MLSYRKAGKRPERLATALVFNNFGNFVGVIDVIKPDVFPFISCKFQVGKWKSGRHNLNFIDISEQNVVLIRKWAKFELDMIVVKSGNVAEIVNEEGSRNENESDTQEN